MNKTTNDLMKLLVGAMLAGVNAGIFWIGMILLRTGNGVLGAIIFGVATPLTIRIQRNIMPKTRRVNLIVLLIYFISIILIMRDVYSHLSEYHPYTSGIVLGAYFLVEIALEKLADFTSSKK